MTWPLVMRSPTDTWRPTSLTSSSLLLIRGTWVAIAMGQYFRADGTGCSEERQRSSDDGLFVRQLGPLQAAGRGHRHGWHAHARRLAAITPLAQGRQQFRAETKLVMRLFDHEHAWTGHERRAQRQARQRSQQRRRD